eukprot:jgi/Mesvir1/27845/Mv07520-RA.1
MQGAADTFTTVSTTTAFGRAKASCCGAFFGVILLIGSIGLLVWNEGRSYDTERKLVLGRRKVVDVGPDSWNTTELGALIHVAGTLTNVPLLKDTDFGILEQTVRLVRKVEMWQWHESSQSRTTRDAFGKETTVTEYTYNLDWDERLISSSNFHAQGGHQNPAVFPVQAMEQWGTGIKVGAYPLSTALIQRIGSLEQVIDQVAGNAPLPSSPLYTAGLRFTAMGAAFYSPGAVTAPQLGDLRVTFFYCPTTEVSVVGQLTADSFAPWSTEWGEVLLLQEGIYTSDEMFDEALAENAALTWVLRAIGWLLTCFSFFLVLSPVAAVPDLIPFIGGFMAEAARCVLGAISLVVGTALSVLTIGIAYIAQRPALAFLLMAILAAIIGAVVYYLARVRKPSQGHVKLEQEVEGHSPHSPGHSTSGGGYFQMSFASQPLPAYGSLPPAQGGLYGSTLPPQGAGAFGGIPPVQASPYGGVAPPGMMYAPATGGIGSYGASNPTPYYGAPPMPMYGAPQVYPPPGYPSDPYSKK